MGVLFIEYPNGSRYLSCLKCDCPIANASPDNMTIDSGRRQYLIKKCVNVKIGHSYNKNSDNRHSVHMVRDVGCLKCNQNLGWSNEFIAEPKKQSKEGKISIFCDKICLRNEKDQKISSRRIELPELLFLSGEFELTASDMDTEDDSEDDSDVDLAEDLSLDEIIGQVTHNMSGAARNAAMRGIRDAAVMRGQGRLARLTDREAQDIIDTAEEEMMNRIANRREENRIYQNQINNFRRQLSIREGSL